MLTAEQMLSTQQTNGEVLFGLTNKALEGVEKLVELNLQATKAATGEAIEPDKSALSVKDAQELLALQAGLFHESADYELRFQSLFDDGRAYAFPCDAAGHVDMDGLSDMARQNYLYVRAVVGREFSMPAVQLRASH